jgi:acyl-CoA synthetase (AMP-forming)/AMP-acid ligase II
VGVLLPNAPEVVAAMFGTWFAGGVYVPLNSRLADREIEYYLEAVRPAVIVTDAAGAARFAAGLGHGIGVVVADGGLGWSAASAPALDVPAHDADIALVQFTSGTTGRPKPVLVRHSGFLKLLDPVLRKLVAGGAEKLAARKAPMPNLIPTSMALSAGIYNVLFAFRVGAPVVIMDGFSTAEFARVVDRFRIRSTVLPPAAMTMLTDDESITSLAPLRYVRSITAPLSPLMARRFRDRFDATVLNCYGQTEIGGEIVGWNAADARAHGEDKLGSVGRPHEGVTLRIVAGDGTELGVDAPGELWVRTPAISAGYADGSALGDRLGPDGWFRTGDVAYVDADGFLWISGRVSDMINRGGLKIFPAEVEEVLRLSPDVVDACVAGIPDDRLGEVPWAFVVPRAGADAGAGTGDGTGDGGADGAGESGGVDPVALKALCREHLAPYKVPVRFVAVPEIPRNEVGKVLRAALVAQATATA